MVQTTAEINLVMNLAQLFKKSSQEGFEFHLVEKPEDMLSCDVAQFWVYNVCQCPFYGWGIRSEWHFT